MNQAKIIALCNQKGGCGKTTLAMNLSGSLAKMGFSVLVIDGDPQATSTKWAGNADDNTPFPCAVVSLSGSERPSKEIIKFVTNYDYIVIDCPPSVSSRFNDSILMVSDLAIVPIVPSPADLWATVGIKDLIYDIKETRADRGINETLHTRLVLNMCQSNISMTKDSEEAIAAFDIEKCKTSIHLRTVYRQAILNGKTILDMRDDKAKTEIINLTNEVLYILNEDSDEQ